MNDFEYRSTFFVTVPLHEARPFVAQAADRGVARARAILGAHLLLRVGELGECKSFTRLFFLLLSNSPMHSVVNGRVGIL